MPRRLFPVDTAPVGGTNVGTGRGFTAWDVSQNLQLQLVYLKMYMRQVTGLFWRASCLSPENGSRMIGRTQDGFPVILVSLAAVK